MGLKNNGNQYERLAILALLGVSWYLITYTRSLQEEVEFLYHWNVVKKIRMDILECKLLHRGCQPWMRD